MAASVQGATTRGRAADRKYWERALTETYQKWVAR
jgi:hypothetical protein